MNDENDHRSGLKSRSRFPEFKESGKWSVQNLGAKTTKVGSGITPTGGDKTYKRSGRPFIRSQNVGWGELLLDDVAFIDEETHASFVSTEIVDRDVLLNITGASIGRSTVADSRVAGGNVNQHVCVIRVAEEALNPIFLNQFLLSQYGQTQIDSFQAGGNRQGLNFAQVRAFSVPIPPTMGEQIKVSGCLSSIDELITVETRKLNTLKAHKLGLMQQLFPVEGETAPRLRFPEFRNSSEWKERRLVECVRLLSGLHLSPAEYGPTGSVPYFTGPSDFTNDSSTVEKWTEPSANVARERDVLITVKGSGVGQLWYLRLPRVSIGRQLMAVRAEGCSSDFLYQILGTRAMRFKALASGNLIPGLSRGDILDMTFHLPSVAEQQMIADLLSTIDDELAIQRARINALASQKNSLMQRLFPVMDEVQA